MSRFPLFAASAVAAQTEVLTSVLGMQGYGGVMFVAASWRVRGVCSDLTAKGNNASSTSSPIPVAQAASVCILQQPPQAQTASPCG